MPLNSLQNRVVVQFETASPPEISRNATTSRTGPISPLAAFWRLFRGRSTGRSYQHRSSPGRLFQNLSKPCQTDGGKETAVVVIILERVKICRTQFGIGNVLATAFFPCARPDFRQAQAI